MNIPGPFAIALICSSVAVLFSTEQSVAQNDAKFSSTYDVEIGTPYPVYDGEKVYIAGDESVLALKGRLNRWNIQSFDHVALKENGSNNYKDMPDFLDLELVGFWGDRAFVFFGVWDRKAKEEKLYRREIDPRSGKFIAPEVLFHTVTGPLKGTDILLNGMPYKTVDKYDMLFSEDGNYMLLQYHRKSVRGVDVPENEIGMVLFDNTMKEIWSTITQLPYASADMVQSDMVLDNNGTVWIIASVYGGTEENTRKRDHADYHTELIRSDANGAGWEAIRMELGTEQKISNASIYQDGEGSIHAAGYYNANGKGTNADGAFKCSFNEKGEVINSAFYEIPTEVINMYVPKRVLDRNERKEADGDALDFTDLVLSSVIYDDDGSLLLVGEKRFEKDGILDKHDRDPKRPDMFYARDLLVTSIDPEGNLMWMKRIPKRKFQQTPIGDTYFYLYSEGQHHFFSFDLMENIDIQPYETPELTGRPIIMVDRMDEENGQLVREAVFEVNNVNGIELEQLSADRMVQIGYSELLIEAYKNGKEDILIRVKVKE